VAVSRALTGLGATSAGAAALAALAPDLAREEARALRRALAAAVAEGGVAPAEAALAAGARVAAIVAGPGVAALAGAVLLGLAQTGGLLAPEALRPRGERLSPGAGIRRIVNPAAAGRALLSTLAGAAALAVGLALLHAHAAPLGRIPALRPGPAWTAALAVPAGVAAPLLGLLAGLGLLDLLHARTAVRRRLRMTRTEVERDQREDSGDPRLRAERRRLHATVSGAPGRPACLVVNPTRIAVALSRGPEGGEDAFVQAKAAGARAAALRREARRLGIPVLADRSLARSLFLLADVGEPIPEELREAAAAVLAWAEARSAGREP
jgi:flagellar biosynthesis protein FlhB